VTEAHLDALERCRDELRSGRIRHWQGRLDLTHVEGEEGYFFSMATWHRALHRRIRPAEFTECGSVCCIGGWTAFYCGAEWEYPTRPHHPALHELFNMSKYLDDMSDRLEVMRRVTPLQAAAAIDDVLYGGGWPRWEDHLKENEHGVLPATRKIRSRA